MEGAGGAATSTRPSGGDLVADARLDSKHASDAKAFATAVSAELAARNLRLGLLAATAVGSGNGAPRLAHAAIELLEKDGRQLAQFIAAQFEASPAPWAGVREALDHLDWMAEEASPSSTLPGGCREHSGRAVVTNPEGHHRH